MDFKGHVTGGLITSIGVAGFTAAIYPDTIQMESVMAFVHSPLKLDTPFAALIGIFGLTWFMSLFPDLDIGSIPQRWFFRSMIVILAVLLFTGNFQVFAICAFFSLFPVIHKHRGWTHWKTTPWIISVFTAIVYEYLRARSSWFGEFKIQNVIHLLQTYWILVFACVAGHYTHLLLDSKSIKWLPFVKNNSTHH